MTEWQTPPNRRPISCIHFALTRKCNQACPRCVCRIPTDASGWEADWEYLERAAESLYGVDRIQLTGGEPSFHPRFVEWVPKLRALFGCRLLTIETNCYGFSHCLETFGHFDFVYITVYDSYSWPGCPYETQAAFDAFRQRWGGRVKYDFIRVRHVPIDVPSRGPYMCLRGLTEVVSYCQGLLYPCCIGWGVPGGKGIPLTKNWLAEIMRVRPPCATCWYGEPHPILRKV